MNFTHEIRRVLNYLNDRFDPEYKRSKLSMYKNQLHIGFIDEGMSKVDSVTVHSIPVSQNESEQRKMFKDVETWVNENLDSSRVFY